MYVWYQRMTPWRFTDFCIGIDTLEALAEQDDIKYGTVEPTSISDFFRTQIDSPYSFMYEHMRKYQTGVVNASEGIEKVRQSHSGRSLIRFFLFLFFETLLCFEEGRFK